MIKIHRFDPAKASPEHNGTILGMPAFPAGMDEPFSHLYGHLAGKGIMDGGRQGHSHPSAEIYIIFEGDGVMIIDNEEAEVHAGDVIEIPRNAPHTMENRSDKPLTWLAIWWK
jgi:mannose-6-phosphate isomerase-like protein (cupin superfamily)